jgi:hypothetical protein
MPVVLSKVSLLKAHSKLLKILELWSHTRSRDFYGHEN